MRKTNTKELLEIGYSVSNCCGASIDLVTLAYSESCQQYCSQCFCRCHSTLVFPKQNQSS